MDGDLKKSFQDKLIEVTKKNFIILVLFSVGLMLIGIGLIQILGEHETEIKFEEGADISGSQGGALQKIKVDVEGAVLKPGVYELSQEARIQDALIAAGGLTEAASRNAINLAAKLADGQKIYVPAAGETVSREAGSGSAGGGSGGSGQSNSNGLISINSVSQGELEELPGIGPVTAGKIIDGRPYGSIQELLDRKVVGKATYEKIKNQISL